MLEEYYHARGWDRKNRGTVTERLDAWFESNDRNKEKS